ncbi:MAG: DNA-3-methyladenine glycosylase [Eubacteriales bacterium]
MKVPERDYSLHADELAPKLLGKLLCRRFPDGGVRKLRITETECYMGESDSACHAHHGKTPRCSVLYEKGGVAYVYLCYGIHHLLNVVCGPEGFPEAVLIRGIEGYPGPGKLTKAMSIDRSLNGADLLCSDEIWLEEDPDAPVVRYRCDRRVGIDYADEVDRQRLWRFILIKPENADSEGMSN